MTPVSSGDVGDSPRRPDGGVDPEAPLRSLLRLFFRSFGPKHAQCFDARFVLAEVEVDCSQAHRILPLWLRPTRPARATLFIVDYRQPTFTNPYREAAMMLHVRSLFGRGVHCCWMVLDDDDSAMIYGRELLAYPKKMARIDWEEEGDRVRAAVFRRGVELLRIEGSKGADDSAPAPIFDVKTFNTGGIGSLLAVVPIWCFRIHERFREARSAQLRVVLTPCRDDPLPKLAQGSPLDLQGRFASVDVFGLRYLFPAGLAALRWFANTYFLRFR